MQLIQLDRDCEQFGIGSVYGQVTVLGCKARHAKAIQTYLPSAF